MGCHSGTSSFLACKFLPVMWPRLSAEPPAVYAAKPQTWLGIQQQQRPRRGKKAQVQPLAELPVLPAPGSATLAQRAEHALRSAAAAHHSEDTVDDKRRAESTQQRLPLQPEQQPSAVVMQADVPVSLAGDRAPHQKAPARSAASQGERRMGTQPDASGTHSMELSTAEAARSGKALASSADVIPCTPVAAAAHVAQPLTQRTRAKAPQTLQDSADPGKEAGAKIAEASGAGQATARPGRQGASEAPQQEPSCGFDDFEFDEALLQTDGQAFAAAKRASMGTPLPSQPKACAQPATTAAAPPTSNAVRAQTLPSGSAAATHGKQPSQAARMQAGPDVMPIPSPTPHRAMRWRGSKPSVQRAKPPLAKPADSDCPSGLAVDPTTAFMRLEDLVQAVQGDQGANLKPCREQETDALPASPTDATPANTTDVPGVPSKKAPQPLSSP